MFRSDDKMFIPNEIIRSRANETTVFQRITRWKGFTGFQHAFEFSTRCVCETYMPPRKVTSKNGPDQRTHILKTVQRSCRKNNHVY